MQSHTRLYHIAPCLHGAKFAEYDGDDNNMPLHSIVPVWSSKFSSLSSCTPRLRTVVDAVNVLSWSCSVLSAGLSLTSCCRVPSQITSDLSGLSLSRCEALQRLMSAMAAYIFCLAWVTCWTFLWMYSCVSSAKLWTMIPCPAMHSCSSAA